MPESLRGGTTLQHVPACSLKLTLTSYQSQKKYILKEKETDYIVYKSTKSSVKIDVPEGTTFATIKNGKTSTKKVEDVLDSHKKLEEPEAETGSINTCTLTFNKNGDCTKITETIR